MTQDKKPEKQKKQDKIKQKDFENRKALREELEYKYKRALADYQNLAKQSAKEKAELVKYANEELVLELLPIYDNLNIAVSFFNENDKKSDWGEGVKHVLRQFDEVLKNFGVKKIEAVGEKFDYYKMEATKTEETDDETKNELVVKELKPGYEMRDRVISPAKVVVYKYRKNI